MAKMRIPTNIEEEAIRLKIVKSRFKNIYNYRVPRIEEIKERQKSLLNKEELNLVQKMSKFNERDLSKFLEISNVSLTGIWYLDKRDADRSRLKDAYENECKAWKERLISEGKSVGFTLQDLYRPFSDQPEKEPEKRGSPAWNKWNKKENKRINLGLILEKEPKKIYISEDTRIRSVGLRFKISPFEYSLLNSGNCIINSAHCEFARILAEDFCSVINDTGILPKRILRYHRLDEEELAENCYEHGKIWIDNKKTTCNLEKSTIYEVISTEILSPLGFYIPYSYHKDAINPLRDIPLENLLRAYAANLSSK